MEHIHVEERMIQLSSYPTVRMDVTNLVSLAEESRENPRPSSGFHSLQTSPVMGRGHMKVGRTFRDHTKCERYHVPEELRGTW